LRVPSFPNPSQVAEREVPLQHLSLLDFFLRPRERVRNDHGVSERGVEHIVVVIVAESGRRGFVWAVATHTLCPSVNSVKEVTRGAPPTTSRTGLRRCSTPRTSCAGRRTLHRRLAVRSSQVNCTLVHRFRGPYRLLAALPG
jgi:hypothetical protein